MAGNFSILFLLGASGIWKSIPVGFVLGVDPVFTAIFTILGASSAVVIIYFMGDRVKRYYQKRMQKKSLMKKSEKFSHLFEKYGAFGVGMLGPVMFGPNVTMALGIALFASGKRILAWTLAGTVLWSVVITIAGVLGLKVIINLENN